MDMFATWVNSLAGLVRALGRALVVAVFLASWASLASAQTTPTPNPTPTPELGDNCTASIQNRTVQIAPGGVIAIPNIPVDQGLYRVRIVCKQPDGTTVGGHSALISLNPNGGTEITELKVGDVKPIPVSLALDIYRVDAPAGASIEATTLATKGETSQLIVTATLPDGNLTDLTTRSSGTTYTTSNPRIATISDGGLITAVSRGQVIVSARNEGVLASMTITVTVPDDADGDGLTDDYERLNGLDPANASDAEQDSDSDGLSNLQEFQRGTNPRAADSDGDGLTDGAETTRGTDPARADSDSDGIVDGQEVLIGTNPLSIDSDSDGIPDGMEIRLGLNPIVANQVTSVRGMVVDAAGVPAAGASIIVYNLLTTTTDATGNFVLPLVPANQGNITVTSQRVVNNQLYAGASNPTPPVAGGITDVGVITLALDSGTVTGVVTDLQNRTVAGAQVTIVSASNVRTAFTDATGRYSVRNLASGNVTVSARDFSTNLRGRAVGTLLPNQSSNIDVRLAPSATIAGTVFARDGLTPVGGVTVRLSGPDSAVVTTSPLGRYQFDFVTLGSYNVEASDEAGNRGRSSVNLSATGQALETNITFLGKGTVSGLVKDASNNPAPNATVQLHSRSIFGGQQTATAGGDGRYVIPNVFVGPFDLSARASVERLGGQAGGRVDSEGQNVSVDITLVASGTLTGTVFRADGTTPASGAQVKLSPTGLSATADASGRYRFELIPVGSYTLTATDPATGDRGGASGAITTQDETRTVNITLRGQGQVVVTVLDGAGAPVGGASVTLTNQFDEPQVVTTQADGTASFTRVLAGGFNVKAFDPATQMSGTASGTVAANATANVTARLQPFGSITGTVLAFNGMPVANMLVRVSGEVARQATSGADGTFRFEILPVGTYALEAVDSAGNVRARVAGVLINAQGEQLTQFLTLGGVGTVAGRVTNADGTPASGVNVSVQSQAPGVSRPFVAQTDLGGNYSIGQVPLGNFVATATARRGQQEHSGQKGGALATHGETATVNIQLAVRLLPTTTTFFDANGYEYDLQATGALSRGTQEVFRGDSGANSGALLLDIVSAGSPVRFAGQSFGNSQLDGRQIAIQQAGMAGLDVTRKVYTPTGGYFTRYLEILSNPTNQPVTVDVRLTSNFRFIRKTQNGFQFDREPRLVSTSSGDALLGVDNGDTRDRWLVVDDDEDLDPFTNTNNLPPVAHVFDGAGGARRVQHAQFDIDFGAQFGQLVEEWRSITVQPGDTAILLHFIAEQTSRASAQASAERLVQLPTEALTGLSTTELSQIRNFVIPSGGSSTLAPLPALGGTVTGTVVASDGVTPVGSAHLEYQSTHPLFSRTYAADATASGQFTIAPTLITHGRTLAVPATAFTLRALNRQTQTLSPATPGAFPQGALLASQNVVFNNTGVLSGVLRRSEDTVASSGTIALSGSQLPSPASTNVAGDGSFVFPTLLPGSYSLSATASHPQGTPLTVSGVAQISEGQTTSVTLMLPATGGVSGAVRRGTAESVINLRVELRAGSFLRDTRTDSAGRFSLTDVPAGTYTLTAFESVTNIAASATVNIVAGQTAQQDLNLVTGGSVTGLVTNPNNLPTAGVQVVISATNGNFTATTGDDGRYRFDSVGLGQFSLLATDPATGLRGLQSGSLSTSGQISTRNIRLFASGLVTGTVFRADGTTPAAGVVVSMTTSTFNPVASPTTGADGRYSIDFVPVGNFTVNAFNPADGDRGRASNQVGANGETRNINVTLTGLGTVTLTVRNSSGNPVGGAAVRVQSGTQFGGEQSGTARADGTFTFERVLAGPYTAFATDSATGLSGAANGTLAVGGTSNVVVQLQPSGTIRGRVLNTGGETAVADARVRLIISDYWYNPVLREVTSAADGSYSFEAVPLGTYTVEALVGGRVRARATQVSLSANAQVATRDLTLVGLGTVTGTVFNPDATTSANTSVTVRSSNVEIGGLFTVRSNAQGVYSVADVPVGAFTATASDPNRRVQGEATGQVSDGQTTTADIHLLSNAIELPLNLYDGNALWFDLQGDGSIQDGTDSIFRGDYDQNQRGFLLDIVKDGVTNRFTGGTLGTSELTGRQVAIRQQNLASLDVTRKLYVPRDGYFARYLELITNPTSEPVTVSVRVLSNLRYSNGSPSVIATSSGNSILSVADAANPDRWAVIDDGADTDPHQYYSNPATGFIFDGQGARERAGAASFTAPSAGQVSYQWNSVTIAPGQTVAYMHFGSQQLSRAAARASAERLVQLPPEALRGLSASEVEQIRNFAVPADGVSPVAPLPVLTGTVNGTVFSSDNTTPLASSVVEFQSGHILFGRRHQVYTNSAGVYTFNSSLNDNSGVVLIPVANFTVSAFHPVTGVMSPLTPGSFVAPQTTATQNIVFSNTGIVRGVVRRHTGVPATGGYVYLSGWYYANIAADGSYVFTGVPPGSYTLTAYTGIDSSVTGTANAQVTAGQTTTADITLQPTGSLTGIVRNASGNAAANAQIWLYDANFNIQRSNRTDSTGRYTYADVPVGLYRIDAYEPISGIPTTVNNVAVVQDQTTTQDITLTGLGQVQVQVNFPGGTPAGNSRVDIFESARGYYRFAGFTDSSGRLTINNVGAAAFTVRAYQPNNTAIWRDVSGTVSHAQTTSVTTTLPALATVRLTVLKADGSVYAGARIDIQKSLNQNFQFAGYTDAAGVLNIGSVPEGTFVVRAYDPSTFAFAGSANGTITPANHGQIINVTINGLLSGTVRGTVYASDGVTPLISSRVDIYSVETGELLNLTFTNNQGFYNFDGVQPGSLGFRVRAAAPNDYNVFVEHNGNFTSTGEVVTVNLIVPTGIVKGTVFYHDGVTPAPYPSVFATQVDAEGNTRTYFTNNEDASGNYSITGLGVGPFKIIAQDDDTGLTATVTANLTSASETLTVNVILPPSGTVTGTVRDSEGNPVPLAYTALTSSGHAYENYGRADSQGVYRFEHVAVGEFYVQAQQPSTTVSGSAVGTVETDGQTVSLDIVLPAADATVRGHVFRADGVTPVAGARVGIENFANGGPQGNFTRNVTADASGFFEATGVPAGTIYVNARDASNSNLVGMAEGTLAPAGEATIDVKLGNAYRFGTYNLDGTDGFRYDVRSGGYLSDGGTVSRNFSDAYDAAYQLKINNEYFFTNFGVGRIEDNGREVVVMGGTGGIIVTRKIFSPPAGKFARFLEILHNPSNTARTVTVEIESNLGSDDSTRLVVSPDQTNNHWIVTDQRGECCDPILGHVYSGNNTPTPAVVQLGSEYNSDDLFYRWNVTIPAGQSIVLMHFATQRPTNDFFGTYDQAGALADLRDPDALAGMSVEEKAQVRNYATTGAVQGHVYAADGQTPVNNSLVIANDAQSGDFLGFAQTNAQGFYRIAGVSQGAQGVRIEAHSPDDYYVVAPHTFTFAALGEEVTADLSLPVGAVRGRVISYGTGTPLPNPQVFVTQTLPGSFTRTYYANSTDDDGNYIIIGVGVGDFSVTAQDADSGLTGTADGNIAVLTTAAVVDITLQASGTVTGRVLDGANNPVPHAEVAISAAGLAFDRYASTDEQGGYRFERVPVGSFFLQSRHPDTRALGAATGTLDAFGDTANVDIHVNAGTGTVVGRVFGTDGTSPVAGASVRVENFAGGGPLGHFDEFVSADSNGDYRVNGVPSGTIHVTASEQGGTSLVGAAQGSLNASSTATINVTLGNAFAFIGSGSYNLDGADGFRYDVICDGSLDDGGTADRNLDDSYDGTYFPLVNRKYLPCANTLSLEDGGREVAMTQSVNGLVVTRKIFSPAEGRFTRYLEVLTNPTGAPMQIVYEVQGNLGSDDQTRVVVSPAETGNRYAVTDQTGECCDPALAHVFGGANATTNVSAVQFATGNDDIFYRWNVTVPAGQSVILMHFTVQRAVEDTSGAQSQAQVLVNLTDPRALEGMSAEEKSRVLNFIIP